MSAEKFNPKNQLKKFKKHSVLILGSLTLVILVIVFAAKPQDEAPKVKKTASSTFSAVKPISTSPADVAALRIAQEHANQDKINQQNAQRMADLESQNKFYRDAWLANESQAAQINEKLNTLNTVKVSSSSPIVMPKQQKMIYENDINSDNSDDASFDASAKKSATDANANASDSSNNSDTKTKDQASDKSISTYIPSNSFVKGILVGSLSANTGGSASSDPTPVLIRLTNLAQLPNEFKSNLKSCMVGGSGWGDLSTERVKIRLTTLSCVLKSGKSIDIPVDGYIDGEDSKAGIAGVVVTHSGALAAKATLAGFVQGIGQIGQAMGQTQSITPLGGVTTTISSDQAVTAGLGSGISQAGSTLSQYYLNMLQQISPAIEVAAGRHVTVIFIKGIELKLPINGEVDDTKQPLPLS